MLCKAIDYLTPKTGSGKKRRERGQVWLASRAPTLQTVLYTHPRADTISLAYALNSVAVLVLDTPCSMTSYVTWLVQSSSLCEYYVGDVFLTRYVASPSSRRGRCLSIRREIHIGQVYGGPAPAVHLLAQRAVSVGASPVRGDEPPGCHDSGRACAAVGERGLKAVPRQAGDATGAGLVPREGDDGGCCC